MDEQQMLNGLELSKISFEYWSRSSGGFVNWLERQSGPIPRAVLMSYLSGKIDSDWFLSHLDDQDMYLVERVNYGC